MVVWEGRWGGRVVGVVTTHCVLRLWWWVVWGRGCLVVGFGFSVLLFFIMESTSDRHLPLLSRLHDRQDYRITVEYLSASD